MTKRKGREGTPPTLYRGGLYQAMVVTDSLVDRVILDVLEVLDIPGLCRKAQDLLEDKKTRRPQDLHQKANSRPIPKDKTGQTQSLFQKTSPKQARSLFGKGKPEPQKFLPSRRRQQPHRILQFSRRGVDEAGLMGRRRVEYIPGKTIAGKYGLNAYFPAMYVCFKEVPYTPQETQIIPNPMR